MVWHPLRAPGLCSYRQVLPEQDVGSPQLLILLWRYGEPGTNGKFHHSYLAYSWRTSRPVTTFEQPSLRHILTVWFDTRALCVAGRYPRSRSSGAERTIFARRELKFDLRVDVGIAEAGVEDCRPFRGTDG